MIRARQRFWHAANLLQFLPRFSLCLVRGEANGVVTDALRSVRHWLLKLTRSPSHRMPSAPWQALIDDELTLLPPEWVTVLAERGATG